MKNIKNSKDNADSAKSNTEDVLDQAIDTLKLGLSAIRGEIQAVIAGRSKAADKANAKGRDPMLRVAFLTTRVGTVADAVRKVEAARARRLEVITPALVLAWLRSLDASERGQIIREAIALDEKRSGLA